MFYEEPIEIVRGEGVYLFDQTGKQYIDMHNNVPCVGHANPCVADAIRKQMGVLKLKRHLRHSRANGNPFLGNDGCPEIVGCSEIGNDCLESEWVVVNGGIVEGGGVGHLLAIRLQVLRGA